MNGTSRKGQFKEFPISKNDDPQRLSLTSPFLLKKLKDLSALIFNSPGMPQSNVISIKPISLALILLERTF